MEEKGGIVIKLKAGKSKAQCGEPDVFLSGIAFPKSLWYGDNGNRSLKTESVSWKNSGSFR